MAACVKLVPIDDWKILRKYLDEKGVVLIPEKHLDVISGGNNEINKALRNMDEVSIEYDFGGDADCCVDFGTEEYCKEALLEIAAGGHQTD